MKTKKMYIPSVIATLVAFIATITTSAASFIWVYQPKTPKSLRK
jgi:cyclic lactone autoinducer peptide